MTEVSAVCPVSSIQGTQAVVSQGSAPVSGQQAPVYTQAAQASHSGCSTDSPSTDTVGHTITQCFDKNLIYLCI